MTNNIKILRKKLNISAELIAEKLDISIPYMYNLETMEKIPLKYIEQLTQLLKCTEKDLCSYELEIQNNQQKNLIQIKYFPDIEASAGVGINIQEDGNIAYKLIDIDMLQFFTASKDLQNHSNLSLIKINGDSMEPILENENWVVVDHNQRTPSESRQIFIIQNNKNQIFIKYIRCKMNGKFDIISANKEYESMMDIDLNAPEIKQFTIIGRVIACIKDM